MWDPPNTWIPVVVVTSRSIILPAGKTAEEVWTRHRCRAFRMPTDLVCIAVEEGSDMVEVGLDLVPLEYVEYLAWRECWCGV